MSDWLLAHETALRLGIFFSVLLVLVLWQLWRPFRAVKAPWRRLARHFALVLLGTLLMRLFFPLLAMEAGARADAANIGLLQVLPMPSWLAIPLAVVLLDLAIYWQHRFSHRWPWFWRLHRIHHSDTHFEVSTAIRFHPVEIALSMLIKIGVVVALGIPAVAVLIFEILLNATALFSHSNVRLPTGLEHRLRQVLVTPEMHRIHHSVNPLETNSNFGFCLPIWDRLFGSYRHTALLDPAKMPIGLEDFRAPADQKLWALLSQPLRQR